MVSGLVDNLGEPSAGGHGRAFPRQAMTGAPEEFYRDVARAGYRGAYLRALAASVAEGSLDLEALATSGLPSCRTTSSSSSCSLSRGWPYAAAHIMMLIGAIHG